MFVIAERGGGAGAGRRPFLPSHSTQTAKMQAPSKYPSAAALTVRPKKDYIESYYHASVLSIELCPITIIISKCLTILGLLHITIKTFSNLKKIQLFSTIWYYIRKSFICHKIRRIKLFLFDNIMLFYYFSKS